MVAVKRARLSKDELLKPKIKSIEIGDGLVCIRALNAEYAISLKGKDLRDDAIFDMLSRSICDEQGAPMLTPEEVGQMPIETVSEIVKGVMAFNSMSEGAAAEAKDTLKNPTSDSITSSP
jgi:hypothetical protein